MEKGSREYYESHFAQDDPYHLTQPDLNLITNYKLDLLREIMPEAGTYRRCVDVGGGDMGIFLSHPQCMGTEFSIACDISFNAMKKCRKHHANTKLPIYFVVADAQHLPFADDTFDFIFSGENLEHLQDADSGRDELHRILDKRRGEGIITVPNEENYVLCPDEHLTNFTHESFTNCINQKFVITLERGVYLNEVPSHQLMHQENGLERIREALHLGRYNPAESMVMIFRVYPRKVTSSLEEQLKQVDATNARINVDLALISSTVPFIGKFIDTVKGMFHSLSIFYVRMLAEQQHTFNREIGRAAKAITENLEYPRHDQAIADLYNELDRLRRRVAELEKELMQDGES